MPPPLLQGMVGCLLDMCATNARDVAITAPLLEVGGRREGGRDLCISWVRSFLAGVGPAALHRCVFTAALRASPSPASSQVLVLLARLQRGAQLLCAGEGLVPACKELLVGMMVRGGGSCNGVPQREYHVGGFHGAVGKSAMKLRRFRTLTSSPPCPSSTSPGKLAGVWYGGKADKERG